MSDSEITVVLKMHGTNPMDYAKALVELYIDCELCHGSEDMRRNLLFLEEIANHIQLTVDTIRDIHSI